MLTALPRKRPAVSVLNRLTRADRADGHSQWTEPMQASVAQACRAASRRPRVGVLLFCQALNPISPDRYQDVGLALDAVARFVRLQHMLLKTFEPSEEE